MYLIIYTSSPSTYALLLADVVLPVRMGVRAGGGGPQFVRSSQALLCYSLSQYIYIYIYIYMYIYICIYYYPLSLSLSLSLSLYIYIYMYI